jgi:hypothetical protein
MTSKKEARFGNPASLERLSPRGPIAVLYFIVGRAAEVTLPKNSGRDFRDFQPL